MVKAVFQRDTELPPFKGSMLRGSMGHALKSTVCAVRVKICEPCLLRTNCVYARIFEVKPNLDQSTNQVNLPHPYVLDGSSINRQFYKAGEEFKFSLLLFGKMIEFLPYFIYTFELMGRKGLGRWTEEGRSEFSVTSVHFNENKIYEPSNPKLPSSLPYDLIELKNKKGDKSLRKLRVHFDTPLRMKDKGRFVRELDFHLLLRAILRRLKARAISGRL